MEQIKVSTFAGPGARPVIHEVPRPGIPKKAALMQVGACGGLVGPISTFWRDTGPSLFPGPFTSVMRWRASSSRSATNCARTTWPTR